MTLSPREEGERSFHRTPHEEGDGGFLYAFNNVYGAFTSRSPAILATERTKELPTVLRKIFTNFVKSLGLTDDNIIFTVPTGSY